MTDRITPQSRPLNILIAALHENHLSKIFDMVDTKSNMKLYDLNSKHHGEKNSGILSTSKLAPDSTLHQAPTITNFFVFESSMNALMPKELISKSISSVKQDITNVGKKRKM